MSSDSGLTGMARRACGAELLGRPCATAQSQPQAPLLKSNPPGPALKPSAFVNGFQKRLVVYNCKTDCHTGAASEDSESDISSLEIDSNLSDSSVPPNPASPKLPFLPQNNAKLPDGISPYSTCNSISNLELSDFDITDNNNSFKQPDFSLKTISQNGDVMASSSNHGSPKSPSHNHQRRSPIAAAVQRTPDTQPLVLKIRRRTWTHGDTSPCGAAKRSRPDSGHARIKPLSKSLDCEEGLEVEWQSVMETKEPPTSDKGKDERTRMKSSFLEETMRNRPKMKHRHHHRKSAKSKTVHHDGVLHRNGLHQELENSIPHSHHACKTRRRKLKRKASKKTPHHSTGTMLRLPSDPQKAVRVLEKALDSINAQIKQLKRETEVDERRTNKPKSRRGRKKKVAKKKKILKGDMKRRHGKGFCAPVPYPSQFKLSDFFSVVPSLVVRDNDLHPAYRVSVDPREPPSASHPIWRWQLGQPPLPRT